VRGARHLVRGPGCMALRPSLIWIGRSNPRVRVRDTAEYIKLYERLGCHPVRLIPLLSILICYFVGGRELGIYLFSYKINILMKFNSGVLRQTSFSIRLKPYTKLLVQFR